VQRAANGQVSEDPSIVSAVLDRLERIHPREKSEPAAQSAALELSFSQLHDFEVCPVRYRFSQVWGVPAPPDDLQPRYVQAAGSTELGTAVHAALAAWHNAGGDLLGLYRGPELGREMLERYLAHPLAAARTLAVEAAFNMAIGSTRVRGLVDRICEMDGRVALVDFKTNATLDATIMEAYSVQLRLYGLAARRGLLPGGDDPKLILFDLRRGEMHEITPDGVQVEARVVAASTRIAAGDFHLGPENANRPCTLCAYRPICPDAVNSSPFMGRWREAPEGPNAQEGPKQVSPGE
jgi:RecB family exonuclease